MTGKRECHVLVKRSVRHIENLHIFDEDYPLRDVMLGRACRRGWGKGISLNQKSRGKRLTRK